MPPASTMPMTAESTTRCMKLLVSMDQIWSISCAPPSTLYLPESPLAGADHVDPEQEVGDRVRQDAGSEAARAIGHQVEQRAGRQGGRPVRARVLKHEGHAYHPEGEPGECAH